MGLIINPRQIIKDGITSLRDVWSSSKVSAELNGKQATLVSGTNIKTINNTSLLGSGDITISGGGDIPKINMTATTATLDPNKFYVWGEVASLDISLAAETADIQNVYKFQFQSGAIATTLTLPSNVSIDGDYPNAIKTTYIVSIESNIAKIERKRKDTLLPNEYQQVEYIESTGTQYISTGIRGNGDLTMKVTMAGNANQWWGFGSRVNDATNAYFYANGGTGYEYGKAYVNYNVSWDIANDGRLNDGNFHTYSIDGGVFLIDSDVLYSFAASSFVSSLNTYLFAFNSNGTVGRFYSCKVREAEFLTDGVYIGHAFPCYRKSDNVAGMYDIVRDVFLTNAGTGNFIVGPDV